MADDNNENGNENEQRAGGYFKSGNEKVPTDWLGAIEDFTKAIELNPDFAEAYVNRGSEHACVIYMR